MTTDIMVQVTQATAHRRTRRNAMGNTRKFALFGLGAVFAAAMSATALTPVTARAAGSNIVTSVFTDESGNYYFPPMAGGKYKVWAQAVTFDTARGEIALGA